VSFHCTPTEAVQCSSRGGCDCDCSWADPSACTKDDGSCCYLCCCGNSTLQAYCPSANDITITYGGGNVTIYDGGWSVVGGGAGATKAAFNLLGGSVDFDIDFSGTHPGVNANLYTISPVFSGSFSPTDYCDGSKTGSDWCVEVDWIESNGNCGGQTTLHTRQGPGSNGCTAWGCAASYYYNGQPSFHMQIKYDTAGHWTTIHDGQVISPSNLSPPPQDLDWSTLVGQYSKQGAVIYGSQWVGWTPVASCGSNGNLAGSRYSIKNLRINGVHTQGPIPKGC